MPDVTRDTHAEPAKVSAWAKLDQKKKVETGVTCGCFFLVALLGLVLVTCRLTGGFAKDYRKADLADWVLRANQDVLAGAPFGENTVCDKWNAVVSSTPNRAAIWMKTSHASLPTRVKYYKLSYTVDPNTGAATLIEILECPGYPK